MNKNDATPPQLNIQKRERKVKTHNLRKTIGFTNLGKIKKPAALCISLLFIISMVSIIGTSTEATTVSFVFGNTSIGTITNYMTTDRDASRFQLTQNGVLQSITAYFANSGFNAKAAIYTDNNGAPSTLITQSNSQAITTSGWQTFTVPQSSLTTGYYWLCVVSSSASYGAMTATSTNSHAWKFSPYSAEYPATFGTPAGYQHTAASIYATCTTLGSATPTPTPTSSPSPSAAPVSTPAPLPSGELTKIAVLSAIASSYSGTHTPNVAIDGTESTANYWGTTSAKGLPQWLQLDLGAQNSISQIVTHFYDGDSRTYTYYVQVSNDGSTWNTVVPTRTGKGITTDIFTRTTGRYVRVTVTGNTANLAAHIEEVKIFRSTNPTSPAPSSTPRPTPTSTPAPSSAPAVVVSGNRVNGIWTQAGSDVTVSQCAFYLSKDISCVYVQTGYWRSDGSISYFISPSQMQTAVANAHAAGLKIYPWVTSQASYGVVLNIGSASYRQNAINNMVNLVRTYGFDGVADDIEELDYNVMSDYVAYFNGAASALHAIGKQYFAAIIAYLPPAMGSAPIQPNKS